MSRASAIVVAGCLGLAACGGPVREPATADEEKPEDEEPSSGGRPDSAVPRPPADGGPPVPDAGQPAPGDAAPPPDVRAASTDAMAAADGLGPDSEPTPSAASGLELGYPGSPPRVPHWGFIHIFESASTLQGRHEYDFRRNANRPACTFERVGPCVLRRCPGGEGSAGEEVHAGRVAVKGSITTKGISYAPLVMVYGKFERYFNRHHDGVQWVPGETLTATGEGGQVPSFEGQWVYPSRFARGFTVPSLDRKGGGTFRWTVVDTAKAGSSTRTVPTNVGQFVVRIPGTPQVTCHGPIGAGSLTIPGAAIAHLPGQVEANVEGAAWGHVRVGEYVLYLEAREEHGRVTLRIQ